MCILSVDPHYPGPFQAPKLYLLAKTGSCEATPFVLYTLWSLNLTPTPKTVDAQAGLSFEFLEDIPGQQRITTGHANGVITLNIAEADPAWREKTREQMHEPYRTLLGHFRHEIGHYYFDRLIAGSTWQDQFHVLFGDEQQDYGASLKRHYDNGPPEDWSARFITAYASSHPWEDWAESWAHYLYMIDTLETAYACGMSLKPEKSSEPELKIDASPIEETSFDKMMENWFALTYVLNSLNRSVGMPDPYPFALSGPVLDKLRFVHTVVQSAR